MKSLLALSLIFIGSYFISCPTKDEYAMTQIIKNLETAKEDTLSIRIYSSKQLRNAYRYRVVCTKRKCTDYDKERARIEATKLSHKFNVPVYEASSPEQVNCEIVIR